MIRRAIERLFAIDVRSLAAFRIVIASIVLRDLFIRFASLKEHYTDAGILTRKQWIDWCGDGWHWSLHTLNGNPAFVTALFAVAGFAGAALLLGWRTRITTVLTWLLLASLHQRNEYINNAGDTLLRVLLFWAMFLPLGQAWSLDAWRRRRELSLRAREMTTADHRHLSVASACIILQFLSMYLFTGLMKLGDDWRGGDAMIRAMSFDLYAKPLAWRLNEHESLLRTLGGLVPWLEIIPPLLCLIPVGTRWLRLIALLMLVPLHLAIEATLTTGAFQWVCLAALLLLIPGCGWDKLLRTISRTKNAADVPKVVTTDPAPRRITAYLLDGGLLFLFIYLTAWNISHQVQLTTKSAWLDDKHAWLGELTATAQKWEMFRDPPRDTGRYIITGTLADGREVDVLTGRLVSKDTIQMHPDHPDRSIDHRWRKYMATASADSHRGHRSRLANALASRWNRMHDDKERLEWIEVVFERRRIVTDGGDAGEPRRVIFHKGPVLREDEIVMQPGRED